MSYSKSNLALGVLCAALAVPTFLQLRSESETFVDVARIPLMFDGFTADNVGSIVLGEPKDEQPEPPPGQQQNQPAKVVYDQLALKLTDQGWVVTAPPRTVVELAGAPVQKSLVERDVFEHLRSIRNDPDTLVQPDATAEQLAEYGLDEQHAFVLRCLDRAGTTVVADLLVGKDASQWGQGSEAVRGVFVRQRDSNDVVLYEWRQPWRRSVEARDWLDKLLFRLEPDKLRRLSIRNSSTGSRTFTFERGRNESRWQAKDCDDLGALRQGEVEGVVQRLRYVAAQSFERPLTRAGNMQALGLFPAKMELQLAVQDGSELREITIEVGDRVPERNEHYVTYSDSEPSAASQFLLTWSAGMVTQFDLDIAQRLFDPKPK